MPLPWLASSREKSGVREREGRDPGGADPAGASEGAADLSAGEGPDLTVVVVTWNARELALRCLESVYAGAAPVAVEVIVVDNASADGTAAAVRGRFPRAVVVENRENVGFPRASNQGLARARGRHVLFLNPDTVVGAGTLAACVGELDREPEVGVVGCRLVYPDGRVQYECARRTFRFRHLVIEALHLHVLFPRHRIFGDQLMGWWDHTGRRDVEAISGAFMMVRRELAEALGGLPEEVFMYHEDLSFCLRVRRAGWRIRFLGDDEVLHLGGGSSRLSGPVPPVAEGEYKLRLIREADGPAFAALGRGVLLARASLRLLAAVAANGVLGWSSLRERHPRLFDLRAHLRDLRWCLSPAGSGPPGA